MFTVAFVQALLPECNTHTKRHTDTHSHRYTLTHTYTHTKTHLGTQIHIHTERDMERGEVGVGKKDGKAFRLN